MYLFNDEYEKDLNALRHMRFYKMVQKSQVDKKLFKNIQFLS